MKSYHHVNLQSAVTKVAGSIEGNEEIHTVFSWVPGEWAFVVLEGDSNWRVLLYDSVDLSVEDISDQFTEPPTLNTKYSDMGEVV